MVMLIYAQKRIHFSRKDTYEMRMQLAVLDWVCTTTLLFVLHVSPQKVAPVATSYIKYIHSLVRTCYDITLYETLSVNVEQKCEKKLTGVYKHPHGHYFFPFYRNCST